MNAFHRVQTELLFNLYKYRQWKSRPTTMKALGSLHCPEIHIAELSDSCYSPGLLKSMLGSSFSSLMVPPIPWEIPQSLDLPPIQLYAALCLLWHLLILFTYATFFPSTIPTDRDHLYRHKQVPKYRGKSWNLDRLTLQTVISY